MAMTREDILKAFEAHKLGIALKEYEDRENEKKQAAEEAQTPEAKAREQETIKALMARLDALEDKLNAIKSSAPEGSDFDLALRNYRTTHHAEYRN
jgi:small-conductance mechanosensitive channel